MSSEQEHFNKLRILLTLKRYEQPPPGYFNRLSGDILAQIRAGQRPDEQLAMHVSWLQRFWQSLERQPVFAGSVGVAVCGLLLAGVAYYTAPEPDPSSMIPVAEALVSGSSPNQIVLSAQLPEAAPLYVGAMTDTGQVHSLLPAPVQRHPYAMPVSAGGFR